MNRCFNIKEEHHCMRHYTTTPQHQQTEHFYHCILIHQQHHKMNKYSQPKKKFEHRDIPTLKWTLLRETLHLVAHYWVKFCKVSVCDLTT